MTERVKKQIVHTHPKSYSEYMARREYAVKKGKNSCTRCGWAIDKKYHVCAVCRTEIDEQYKQAETSDHQIH